VVRHIPAEEAAADVNRIPAEGADRRIPEVEAALPRPSPAEAEAEAALPRPSPTEVEAEAALPRPSPTEAAEGKDRPVRAGAAASCCSSWPRGTGAGAATGAVARSAWCDSLITSGFAAAQASP